MKLFEKEELKHLWPFYLSEFVISLFFIIAPFQVLYFNSIGLSATKIGFLIAIFPLTTLIFEIPTGAIADLYGRKFSVLSGYFLEGIVLILIFLFKNYYMLLFLMFISAIAYTLTSGSFEAWVVDLVKSKKRNNLIKSYFGKSQSLLNLGLIFSGLLGAFLVAVFDLRIMWLVGGGGFILGGFLLLFGEEKYQRREIKIKAPIKNLYEQTKKSILYGYRHYVLFFLLSVSLILGIVGSLESLISWTPFLKSFNFPNYSFGYLWSAMGVLGVIAPLISSRLIKNKNERNILIMLAFLTLIYGFIVLFSNHLYLLLGVILFGSFLLDFEVPVWRNYFHRFISSNKRATVSSVRSMIFSLGAIIGMPLTGYLVDKIGGRYTIFISSLLMIPVIFLYLRIKEERLK